MSAIPTHADVVIAGAGIAGIATAYYLTSVHGVRDVVLIEPGPPMMLTSAKPVEGYRNWWGDGAMVQFMNRSLDLLEQLADATNNIPRMSRRGYLFASAQPESYAFFERVSAEFAALGVGAIRHHTGNNPTLAYTPPPADDRYAPSLSGADLISDPTLIRTQFGYLPDTTRVLLHARRCGWFSASSTGGYLLAQAQAHGARLIAGSVSGVQVASGRVGGVQVTTADGSPHLIQTRTFVNAAGPFLNHIAAMMGLSLPMYTEPHYKISFRDVKRIVPRDAPLVIWFDPIRLVWRDDERAALEADPAQHWLLGELPAEMHWRPAGRDIWQDDTVIVAWTYRTAPEPPTFPFAIEPRYPELVLRGLASILPEAASYIGNVVGLEYDGGYYNRTQENRPLIGRLPIEGAYVLGALSGFGLMGCLGAGELLTAHITGGTRPSYADAFAPQRYADPAYQQQLQNWPAAWQL